MNGRTFKIQIYNDGSLREMKLKNSLLLILQEKSAKKKQEEDYLTLST